MSEWKTYKMRELCSDIIDCVNKTAPISDVETPYKMLRTSDIRDGRINLENLNSVSADVFSKWTRRGALQAGDVIFTREAPLGEVGLVRIAENYFLGQRLVLFRANPDVCDNRFLMYSLLYHENKQAVIAKGVGATVLHLRVPECEKIEIKAPSLRQQKRIADILSAYDDLIENNQKQIKLLEEAAQRLYKEWFVDLRFPSHETTPIINGIPEGWTYKQVCELGEVITGKTPSTEISENYGADIPFVTIPDMHKNIFTVVTERKLSFEGANSQKSKYIPANSIMVSCIATVGLVCISNAVSQTNQQINSVVLKDPKNLYFLYEAMKGIGLLLDGLGSNGATMTNVNKKKFSGLRILSPSESLIHQYQDYSTPIFAQIRNLEQSILILQQARDRLLPELMNGEIEV